MGNKGISVNSTGTKFGWGAPSVAQASPVVGAMVANVTPVTQETEPFNPIIAQGAWNWVRGLHGQNRDGTRGRGFGLDITAPTGTELYATKSGNVIYRIMFRSVSGRNRFVSFGVYAELTFADGTGQALYAHLSATHMDQFLGGSGGSVVPNYGTNELHRQGAGWQSGDRTREVGRRQVYQDDLIGFVGNTGNSSGAHLHFSLNVNGHWINPAQYINIPYRGILSNPQLQINGEVLQIPAGDQLPVVLSGRALVPLRSTMEALGFDVEWNPELNQANLTKPGFDISFTTGSRTMVVNGNETTLSVPARIMNGRVMVPLRAISEAAGMEVRWDGENSIAHIIQS